MSNQSRKEYKFLIDFDIQKILVGGDRTNCNDRVNRLKLMTELLSKHNQPTPIQRSPRKRSRQIKVTVPVLSSDQRGGRLRRVQQHSYQTLQISPRRNQIPIIKQTTSRAASRAANRSAAQAGGFFKSCPQVQKTNKRTASVSQNKIQQHRLNQISSQAQNGKSSSQAARIEKLVKKQLKPKTIVQPQVCKLNKLFRPPQRIQPILPHLIKVENLPQVPKKFSWGLLELDQSVQHQARRLHGFQSLPQNKFLRHLQSRAYCVLDMNSGQKLMGHNDSVQKQIASLTKVMCCLTVILVCKKLKCRLDVQVRVGDQAASMEGTAAGLKAGDLLSIDQLLYGLMLPSGNDAAIALAYFAGRQMYLLKQKRKQ